MGYFVVLVVFAQLLGVAIVAQAWRGHPGVIWATVALLLDAGLLALLDAADKIAPFSYKMTTEVFLLATTIMIIGPTTLLMLLAIATWPKRS